MRVELNGKSSLDNKKVWSFAVDTVSVFLSISLINLLIVNVFNLSPRGLLQGGIETALYERKMGIFDWISISYVALIVFYLSYLRKYFSLGDLIFGSKK